MCLHTLHSISVNTDEICAAIKTVFNDTRSVMEPAGALAVAGCCKFLQQQQSMAVDFENVSGSFDNHGVGGTYVAITSGANMDFDRLRFVSYRADALETPISVRIPEGPGSFLELYHIIYPRNVTEFSYRYTDDEVEQVCGDGPLVSTLQLQIAHRITACTGWSPYLHELQR